MASPCIAITVGREEYAKRRFDAVPHEYVTSVLAAGGTPILLPPLPAALVDGAMEAVDGLLLTGGGDVAPARYGADAMPETDDVDEERDASEIAVVAAARRDGLPILGICRGAQLLNVAFGGTLHQHLSPDGNPVHQQGKHRNEAVHTVDLEPASLLARLTGRTRLDINSIHHQGIDRVAPPLRAVGRAADGLVEVLESEELRVLAVQWHPECLPREPSSGELFGWLVATARRGTDRPA
jgi:putative glutamine amidotransferase